MMKIIISTLLLFMFAQFVIVVSDLKRHPQCLETDNPIFCTQILNKIGG